MSGTNRLGIKGVIVSLIAAGALCTGSFAQIPEACGPGAGPCGEPNATPGCEDPACCAAVCEIDPICCILQWDQTCANIAISLGCADGDGCPPGGPPPSGCIPAPAGLISWWPGDGNANDIEDDNDGTLLGGATFNTGQFGLAFVFGGVSADGVTVPDTPSLNFGVGDDFSIDAWILAPSGASGIRVIVDKRDAPGGPTAVGYVLFLFGSGQLSFQLADAPLEPNNFSTFISSGPDLRDGNFHHVAVTVDRDSSTGGTLYVDGCVVLTFDPTLRPGSLVNNKPLLIGKHQTAGFPGAYLGRIDEVEIYNRALLASEIHDLFLAIDGKCKDSDKDGVLDDVDCQPNSDLSATVVIDGCDSMVLNELFGDGCTILDLIAFCADDANTHGEFKSCVAELTNSLRMQGIISGAEKGAIEMCAAMANIP